MLNIGITGSKGFIGSHLKNTLELYNEGYNIIEFSRTYFDNEIELDSFVKQCDVIVHLSALNRHEDQSVIYETNVKLVEVLIESLERTNSDAHVIMSSSSQENKDNLYGQSKREGRKMFSQWAKRNNTVFTGLIIPNVFGPFGKPFYNSVVATFAHQVVNNLTPTINGNSIVNLIYVGELVERIIEVINDRKNDSLLEIEATSDIGIQSLLDLLLKFKLGISREWNYSSFKEYI